MSVLISYYYECRCLVDGEIGFMVSKFHDKSIWINKTQIANQNNNRKKSSWYKFWEIADKPVHMPV